MDSITQIVLGASVGEAVGGKTLGRKAALWGAIFGTVPDLDVFLRFWYDPVDGALIHRGFSHSLLFAILSAPLFGFLLFHLYKRRYNQILLIKLVFLTIVTHPLLDIFTNYGTQFFWPLDSRLSTNSIFVIDPLYTVPFIIFLIIALVKKKEDPIRRKWNNVGLIYSTSYLLIALAIKTVILTKSHDYFKDYQVKEGRTLVTPMPFTTFYWMIVTEGKDDFYIGYKSLFYAFDEQEIDTIHKNHELLKGLTDSNESIKKLKFISKGYYTCDQQNETLIFYDIRFGTASKLTSPKINEPVRGFGMVIDSNNVNKTTHLRRDKLWNQINFENYFKKVFRND